MEGVKRRVFFDLGLVCGILEFFLLDIEGFRYYSFSYSGIVLKELLKVVIFW